MKVIFGPPYMQNLSLYPAAKAVSVEVVSRQLVYILYLQLLNYGFLHRELLQQCARLPMFLNNKVHLKEVNLCSLLVLFREGNEPGDEKTVTYRELLQQVCKFANVLKSQGTFN